MSSWKVFLGEPDVEEYDRKGWELHENGKLTGRPLDTFKKFQKTLRFLSENPRHPGLKTHEISDLTRKAGFKVFESYLENNVPAAGRIFWCYGPKVKSITILSIDPHPDDKKSAYSRISLSDIPDIE